MQRVLLSCKSLEDARVLKNYIETELPYEVLMAFDQREIEQAIRNKTINLLLLQTGNLAREDIQYALRLRQLGFAYPMLMLTESLGGLNIQEITEKHKIYFLERPFEFRTLRGVARKLMITRTIPQQVFRRFKTNVTATMETFISTEKYEAFMFNLSRGGAYFEFAKRPGVSVGDLLRMKVPLADVDRKYQVHGRVVWTTHKGHAAGGYGMGVKFMKGSDIYRNLLDK